MTDNDFKIVLCQIDTISSHIFIIYVIIVIVKYDITFFNNKIVFHSINLHSLRQRRGKSAFIHLAVVFL